MPDLGNDKGAVIQIDRIAHPVRVLLLSRFGQTFSCIRNRQFFAILFHLNLLRQLRHLLYKRAASERFRIHNLAIDDARISQPLTHGFGVDGLVIARHFFIRLYAIREIRFWSRLNRFGL